MSTTTSPSSKPTILILHGSWHQPSHFTPLTNILTSPPHSYPTICPSQPTSGALPPITLQDDAAVITSTLHDLTTVQSKDLIVLAHSYGCILASESVKAEFASTTRKQEGKEGGVLGLIFMCGFVIPKGLSLAGAFGGNLPPFIVEQENGQCTITNPEHIFYHDLPADQQAYFSSLLVPVPYVTQTTPLTYAGYLHHPLTYLYCENDQALPFEVQKMMVETNVKANKVEVKEEYCTASHSPFLSMPEKVVEIIEKVATESHS